MKDSYNAKVVYLRDLKVFDGDGQGDFTEEFSQAMPYYEFDSDERILSGYDDDFKNQAEIWKVKITMETVDDNYER
jgi:hypothetical protein